MTTPAAQIRIWDIPVRLVHWLLVLLVAVSWRTAESGQMEYHRYSGYAVLGLLCFRIYWGFFGSSTARFANFVRGPRIVLAYLRRLPLRVETHRLAIPGHNPLGALSVIALLSLLAMQVILGLFAVDVDGIESGPLSTYVSFDAGRTAAHWHGTVFDILVWFIGAHVAAVLFYLLYKRQNLVASMLHGKQMHHGDVPPVAAASPWRLLAGILLAALVVWLTARGFQL
jgi:cytochrome b